MDNDKERYIDRASYIKYPPTTDKYFLFPSRNASQRRDNDLFLMGVCEEDVDDNSNGTFATLMKDSILVMMK